MGNIFKNFARFGGLDPKSRPFLLHLSATINEKPIMMSLWFFSLLKIHIETIKGREYLLTTVKKLYYISILSKP